jgi:CheY-like chemotaxis protein
MSKQTILVVEDSDDIRGMMRAILEMDGYLILEAANGQQAIERALEGQPNLILMDLSMPVMDGWEATRKLRLLNHMREVPIIGLSAHCHDEPRELAIKAGCNDCIAKPIDEDVLNGILSEYLTVP